MIKAIKCYKTSDRTHIIEQISKAIFKANRSQEVITNAFDSIIFFHYKEVMLGLKIFLSQRLNVGREMAYLPRIGTYI